MAIPVDYFQPESFQQANPLLSGISAGQGIYQQMVQNQYLKPMLQQQLQQAQLNNQILQPQAQYAPQLTQADLALKQAQLPYLQAQTGLVNAQTQFFPMTAQGQYLRGMGDYLRGSYMLNPSHLTAQFQNNPAFQSMVANNPQLSNQLANVMAGTLYGSPYGLPQGAQNVPQMNGTSQIPVVNAPVNYQQAAGDNIPLTAQQKKLVNSLLPSMQNTMTNFPLAQQPQGILNNQDVQNLQSGLTNAATKTQYTPQVMNQLTYEQSVENQLAKAAPLLPSISKYAGVKGAVQLQLERIHAMMGGQPSADYQNFRNFTNVQAPMIANEIGRALGNSATDQQKQWAQELADPIEWHSNPQLMLSHMQTLVNSLRENAKAIAQTHSQTLQSTQQGIANPIQIGQQNSPHITKTIGGNTYVKINGKWYPQ